jgi:hypothetical protein
LRYQRWINIGTTRLLLHASIPNNIGFSSSNFYSWMKKIHTIRMMKIILYTKRTISRSLGRPKNLLPFEVQNMIRKGKSKHVICHNSHTSSNH